MATETREPSTKTDLQVDLAGPMADWYDRSSLVGEFMVAIEGQSVEDYLRRAPENRFCEYIDGVVYMPSPATLWHQFDVQLLTTLLDMFIGARRLGHLLTGPACLRISPTRYLEPDIFVVPFDPEAKFEGFLVDPPVLLVVEVLSKSTRSHDLKRKAELYREAGVGELWLIDDRRKVLIVHRRVENGYEVEELEAGPYRSTSIPGFWFSVSWLWARPRPNMLACLESIMAGPPA